MLVLQASLHPFVRCKISSGETTLLDINEASLLNSILYLSQVNESSLSDFERSMIGEGTLVERQAFGDAIKEYIIHPWPMNTVLFRDGLMNLETQSPIICEFWTLNAGALLYSPANDTAATYALSNIE